MTRCSWCGLGVSPLAGLDPPTCVKCKKPLCSPSQRDCAWEHWTHTHVRKVRDVETEKV